MGLLAIVGYCHMYLTQIDSRYLTAMGLRYFDAKDYLEAVKRDDALAVELFVAGRGVNLASRDADGRTAAEIARANGNARLAELLAR